LTDNICTFWDDGDRRGKKTKSVMDLTVAAEEVRESQTNIDPGMSEKINIIGRLIRTRLPVVGWI
jgi:hypothetical protein